MKKERLDSLPSKKDIKTEINFDVNQDIYEPEIKLATATHQFQEIKIKRIYRLTEDLEEFVEDRKVYLGGENLHELRMKMQHGTESVSNIKQWIEANHNADPQTEFENFLKN